MYSGSGFEGLEFYGNMVQCSRIVQMSNSKTNLVNDPIEAIGSPDVGHSFTLHTVGAE